MFHGIVTLSKPVPEPAKDSNNPNSNSQPKTLPTLPGNTNPHLKSQAKQAGDPGPPSPVHRLQLILSNRYSPAHPLPDIHMSTSAKGQGGRHEGDKETPTPEHPESLIRYPEHLHSVSPHPRQDDEMRQGTLADYHTRPLATPSYHGRLRPVPATPSRSPTAQGSTKPPSLSPSPSPSPSRYS
ncbi:hypothetical protein B0J18DRAFT_410623 [Chaetomium sp. MPI-SDFR-AT-0129]|nr:hypothetical protein B0J18DRAFT_410623 [Chaetomium sp. MPI-SDFR-AT-0129]